MYKVIKIYFPKTCMIFTLVMLATVVMDFLYRRWNAYDLYMLEILGIITLFYTVDYFIAKINFKTYKGYVITNYSIMLGLYLVFANILGWMQLTIGSIIRLMIPFTVIYMLMYAYISYMNRKEADRINQLLKE